MRLTLACVLSACVCLVLGAPTRASESSDLEATFAAGLAETDPGRDAEHAGRLARALEAAEAGPDALAPLLSRAWPRSEAPEAGAFALHLQDADGRPFFVHGYLPDAATPDAGWPVLLWLHGDLYRDQEDGGREALAFLGERAEEEGFVLIAPDADSAAAWWTRAGERRVLAALDAAHGRLPLDADRVAVAGRSDGGSACFHLLVSFPDPFCAFFAFVGNPHVAAAAGGPLWDVNLAARPVYAVAGGRDRLYPAAGLAPTFEDLAARGCRLTWHEEPEAGHDLSFLEARWPEIRAFWQDHPRERLPRTVAWTTSRPEGARRAWIEIRALEPGTASADPVEAPAGREVAVDRGYAVPPGSVDARLLDGNRFEIRTDGIRSLRLHLWEGLVDFEAELVVELDGREVFRGVPPQDLVHLLREARRAGPGAPLARGTLDLDPFLAAATADSSTAGG